MVPILSMVLLASPQAPASRVCHTYEGTIGGRLISAAPVVMHNHSECEARCLGTADCYAYTFTAYGLPGQPGQRQRAQGAPPQPRCTEYNSSNIGGGQNMPGTPTPTATPGACCALCASTPACLTWTFAASSSDAKQAPCWLHPFTGGVKPESTKSNWPFWMSGVQHSTPQPKGVGGCQLFSAPSSPEGTFVKEATGVTSGLCEPGTDVYDRNPLYLINATGWVLA